MRRISLAFIIILSLFSVYGFAPLQQLNATITVLNRSDKTTSQITDGDTLKLQITLSQSVAQQENITFTLGDQSAPVAACSLAIN